MKITICRPFANSRTISPVSVSADGYAFSFSNLAVIAVYAS